MCVCVRDVIGAAVFVARFFMSNVSLRFLGWCACDGASDHVNPKASQGCRPAVWSSDILSHVTGNSKFGISTHKHNWQWIDRISNQMDRERTQQSLTSCLIIDANPVRHSLILPPLRLRWGYVGNAFGIMGTVACSAQMYRQQSVHPTFAGQACSFLDVPYITCPFAFILTVWLHVDNSFLLLDCIDTICGCVFVCFLLYCIHF